MSATSETVAPQFDKTSFQLAALAHGADNIAAQAKLVGLSRWTLYRLFENEGTPKADTLRQISERLGVPVSEFYRVPALDPNSDHGREIARALTTALASVEQAIADRKRRAAGPAVELRTAA